MLHVVGSDTAVTLVLMGVSVKDIFNLPDVYMVSFISKLKSFSWNADFHE